MVTLRYCGRRPRLSPTQRNDSELPKCSASRYVILVAKRYGLSKQFQPVEYHMAVKERRAMQQLERISAVALAAGGIGKKSATLSWEQIHALELARKTLLGFLALRLRARELIALGAARRGPVAVVLEAEASDLTNGHADPTAGLSSHGLEIYPSGGNGDGP